MSTGKKKSGMKDVPVIRNGWKKSMNEAMDAALKRRGQPTNSGNSWKAQKAAHVW